MGSVKEGREGKTYFLLAGGCPEVGVDVLVLEGDDEMIGLCREREIGR